MKTLVEARRNFYKFLASVYLEAPSHEFINAILDPSFLQGLIETFGNSNSEYLLNFSNSRGTAAPCPYYEAVKQDYMDLFRVPLSKYVTPYESVYRDKRIVAGKEVGRLLMGESTLAVKKIYNKAGLEISKDFAELPDHLGTELYFLYHLCEMEKNAWEREEKEEALRLLGIERDFLNDHLSKWISDVCDDIIEKAETDFYKGIATITNAFIFEDLKTLRG